MFCMRVKSEMLWLSLNLRFRKVMVRICFSRGVGTSIWKMMARWSEMVRSMLDSWLRLLLWAGKSMLLFSSRWSQRGC